MWVEFEVEVEDDLTSLCNSQAYARGVSNKRSFFSLRFRKEEGSCKGASFLASPALFARGNLLSLCRSQNKQREHSPMTQIKVPEYFNSSNLRGEETKDRSRREREKQGMEPKRAWRIFVSDWRCSCSSQSSSSHTSLFIQHSLHIALNVADLQDWKVSEGEGSSHFRSVSLLREIFLQP